MCGVCGRHCRPYPLGDGEMCVGMGKDKGWGLG